MANIKISQMSETMNIQENDYIPIIQNGDNKKVKIKYIKGANNLTDNYVELIGDDDNLYRVEIVNGKMVAYPSEVDTVANATDNKLYDGLIINKMYGGGSAIVNTPVSHSFIELYNMKNVPLNLKGLYLWYKSGVGTWQSLALRGIVPPYHSFLIRCGEHNDYHKDFVRCYVENYDMSWDIKLSNQGFSAYLCIGSETPEDNPVRQTKDAISGTVTWTNTRYIDLLGCGGKDLSQNVSAYETRFLNCMDINTGVMREDFANSGTVNIGTNKSVYGNNEADCMPIDYSICNIEKYRPRSLQDGEWDVYYDKPRLRKNCPNFINICYGENGDNTRTFTWQTEVSDVGFIKYKKQGTNSWTKKESNKRIVRHKTEDVTVHSVIVNNLEVGIYEYQVGFEGCWSDIEIFEVKTYNTTNPIKFLITSDEQSWSEKEYSATGVASKYIQNNESFDFHMNLGDISQNAVRYFEWFFYNNYYPTNKNVPHITTCGNNDLINKKYSDAFTYYTTYENQVYNSVYSYDLGFTHFVCLNSNTDYTYVNNDGSIGGFADTDKFLQAQADWLDTHLTEVNSREVKPRWIIVYSHLSPFTVGRTVRLQRWVSVVEKHKVDLFLCGHNHAYSRSKALYTGYDYNINPNYNDYTTKVTGTSELKIVDELKADGTEINRVEDKANGTVYILQQSAGFKLSGKEKPITLPQALQGTKHDNGNSQPWWIVNQSTPSQPSYTMVEIGYNSIILNMYYIKNILEKDVNGNVNINPYTTIGDKAQTKYEFDTLTINYADRNK